MKIQKTFDIGEKSSRKSTICIQSNKISGCYHLLYNTFWRIQCHCGRVQLKREKVDYTMIKTWSYNFFAKYLILHTEKNPK